MLQLLQMVYLILDALFQYIAFSAQLHEFLRHALCRGPLGRMTVICLFEQFPILLQGGVPFLMCFLLCT